MSTLSWHDAWQRLAYNPQPRTLFDRTAAFVLGGAAGLYGAGVALRNLSFTQGWRQPATLPCPVISIGNLTVGGTGKTACVELVVRKLQAQGRRVGVLSRGHGGQGGGYVLRAEAGRLTADGRRLAAGHHYADEPQLLARHLEGVPVGVSPRRAAMGRHLCQAMGCDMVVLDDGFQHRQLHRDCDIVLVSARMPLGTLGLLPRGPLREPLAGLQRAHILVITKADEAPGSLAMMQEWLHALNPTAAIATAAHKPIALLEAPRATLVPLSQLAGTRVGLVSSIGDPEGFEATARRWQAVVRWHEALPDHHRFTAQDWMRIGQRAAQAPVQALLTTEKDWVRLQPVVAHAGAVGTPLWVLQVALCVLSGEAQFDDRLARVSVR